MARRCFYSFHYVPDSARASQVRNIGAIEGNRPATDNDWETITRGGDPAIERWIDDQMRGTSCTVVLVGTHTANRKWINREIVKTWNSGRGIVGIHVHGLKDLAGSIAAKGSNPFEFITLADTVTTLSTLVKCYDPPGGDSKARYAWIQEHLANAVEEAIAIRKRNA